MDLVKYEALEPIDRKSVIEALSGPDCDAAEALIRASLTIRDRVWVESLLLSALSDQRLEVQKAALLGLGHLARIHHALDLERIIPILRKYAAHASLGGVAEDALDDIAMFIPRQ